MDSMSMLHDKWTK